MRKTTYSEQEIAELDETRKKEARSSGLKLMPVRDRGMARLSNGITVRWHTSTPPKVMYETKHGDITVIDPNVTDGDFVIEHEHGRLIFNAEELRKYLRWA